MPTKRWFHFGLFSRKSLRLDTKKQPEHDFLRCWKYNDLQVGSFWSLKIAGDLIPFFRIEKYIREVGLDSRAKRMGYCGNTIFVKVKKGDPSNVLYEP